MASTDYAAASNWQTNSVPTAANLIAFYNNPGTVTGTGNAPDVSIRGTGIWTFSRTSITVAGAGGTTPGIQVDGNINVTGSTASLNASSSPPSWGMSAPEASRSMR